MPVCKIGCDDFFEKGFVVVDPSGCIRVNHALDSSDDLKNVLAELDGKRCTYFNNESRDFFASKRECTKAVWR